MTAASEWADIHMSGGSWEMQQVVEEVRSSGVIGAVLEIGTFRGDSLRVWREEFDPIALVGIQDTNETTPEVAVELGATIIRGKSQDPMVAEEVWGRFEYLGWHSIDFLYIDGDHTYDAVLRDWQLYAPLVREGGVIVLHDAVIENNPTVDVWRLYREVRNGRRSKLIYGGPRNTGAAVLWA